MYINKSVIMDDPEKSKSTKKQTSQPQIIPQLMCPVSGVMLNLNVAKSDHFEHCVICCILSYFGFMQVCPQHLQIS